MAPRKRASSSSYTSKKTNLNRHQPPPSKYGIHHFFERHSQSQAATDSPCPPGSPKPNTNPNITPSPLPNPGPAQDSLSLALPPQPAASGNGDEFSSQASPEFAKNAPVPLKRLKFSPGLLIKQSQDDGGDEITWKISPVNDRLKSLTAKQLPRMMRILSDPPRQIASFIHPCLLKQNSTCPADESLEKWLSSPTAQATGRSLASTSRLSILKETEVCHSNGSDSVDSLSKAFQTPPSASYVSSELTAGGVSNGVSDELSCGQHCKALLELLDQVEDVITEESVPSSRIAHEDIGNASGQKKKNSNFSVCKTPVTTSQRIDGSLSDEVFLVLEVSEKHTTDSSLHVRDPCKVLRLLNELTGEERSLHLCDEWFYSIIEPGDTVNVIGYFDVEGKCIVNHSNNLVVVFPDLLISGTRVASSFSCPRRAVLDERLKSNEHSTSALIGTLLHQIFQAGLLEDYPTRHFLEECATIILQKNNENLYACGANQDATLTHLLEAIPRLLNWIKCFRDTEEGRTPVVDFGHNEGEEVSILEVMDIEEMAWAPKYGLKGVIDASLRIKRLSGSGDSLETIMPLEFKTGKRTTGQSAMEHSAQVILYTLLMSERYLTKNVDSGLLYYLHTNETKGIKVQRSDLVGLIMRRNELASDILKASTCQLLPPMIKNPMVCKGCRHLNSCMIYHKAYAGNQENSGLGDLFDRNAGHLTVAHVEFLKHWDRLIDLEAKTRQVASKEIMRARHLTENNSSCLSSLVLDVTNGFSVGGSPKNGRYVYHFVQKTSSKLNHEMDNIDTKQTLEPQVRSLVCSLRCGDYVIISMENGRPAVANGIICGINQFCVSISLSRRLRIPGSHRSSETADLIQEVWRIDKDEVASSYAVMRFNLVELFVPSVERSRLRKMIVELEAPRFDSSGLLSQDPAVSYVHLEKCINDDQRRAIQKILSAKDYTLILGMPGTGKTSTMVHAVKALLIRGSSILLTSYTNSAVDNLLIKLKAQGIDFIRLGRQEAVHDDVRDHCISDPHCVDEVRERMENVRVVGVTCLGINHPFLVNRRFDVCIMDEAGQITLPVSLGPLMLASTFILVGDHYQLPPLVQSAEAREKGMAVSLFCRLTESHPQAISALQCQYRMSAGIMELSNALIYGDRLRCGSHEVANAKIKLSLVEPITWWIKEVLNPNTPVVFINTDELPAPEVREQNNVHNPSETRIISEITSELLKREIAEDEIGIITPYNLQASFIQRATSPSVEIHTIDKYQGRDKDCLLVSFVRSSENSKACTSSVLGDWHRINVAITRAKKKLIMVGSCGTLSKVPLLKILIEKVNEQGGLLSISTKDFGRPEVFKKCSQLSV